MNDLLKNLAFAHRIIAHLKMDDLTYTHISGRLPFEDNFFISPFGIQFENVLPDDLINFTLEGKLISGGSLFNPTGLSIHSCIYKAHPETTCVIHLHTAETIAVSVLKQGLLPLSQHALHFYNSISSHSYNSLILDVQKEEEILIHDLGKNNVMFLENHGFITTGETIWEALFYAYHLQRACEIQVCLAHVSRDELIIPSPEVCAKAQRDLLSFEKDLGRRDFESFKRIITFF